MSETRKFKPGDRIYWKVDPSVVGTVLKIRKDGCYEMEWYCQRGPEIDRSSTFWWTDLHHELTEASIAKRIIESYEL